VILEKGQRLRSEISAGPDAKTLHLARVTGPMPWNFPTGSVAMKRTPCPV
jgi:hypothetical protein